jgi:hypothetical protein
MEIPFDNNTGEKYSLSIIESEIENGDGVVLELNRKACESFATLFTALAKGEQSHIHLGYDESEPQGPGFRIVLTNNTMDK